jgi:hypothetical protein
MVRAQGGGSGSKPHSAASRLNSHGNAVPAWNPVCHLGGFTADCLTRFFPDARSAWRIAGPPKPGEEAKAPAILILNALRLGQQRGAGHRLRIGICQQRHQANQADNPQRNTNYCLQES